MNTKHLLATLTAALALTACGVDTTTSDDQLGQTDDQLLNASVDYRHKWSVGVCAGPLNTDAAAGPIGACLQAGTRCTGSLIAPNLVLTARHCVHEIDYSNATDFCTGVFTTTPLSTAGVHVTTSLSTIGPNPTWYQVDQVLTPPTTNASCAGDLVILKLHNPIPRSVARPVLVDVRDLTTHKPNQVAVVGRGVVDETFDITDYSVTYTDQGGLKRRVLEHIPFVCVSNTVGVCSSPDIGATFFPDTGYAEIGEGPLSGDSGAGIVRQWSFSADLPLIVGVNSAGTVDPVTGKSNFGYATRVDRHAAFIRSALHQCSPQTHALVEND